MGLCIYQDGVEVLAKTLKVHEKLPISQRLTYLHELLDGFIQQELDGSVDLVLIEKVRSSSGHVFLVWAAGGAISACASPVVIEIPAYMWKKVVDKDYVKTDEMDARYMFKLAHQLCEEDV